MPPKGKSKGQGIKNIPNSFSSFCNNKRRKCNKLFNRES